MEFGNKIIQGRKAMNLTQEQLAEKLGVARQTLARWENNLTSPDAESLGKMAQIFGVSVGSFYEEKTQPMPAPAYLVSDYQKQKNSAIINVVISGIMILGAAGTLGYGIYLQSAAIIIVASFIIVLFGFFLYWMIYALSICIHAYRYLQSGDSEAFLAWLGKKLKHRKAGQDRYQALAASTYLDLNRVKEAKLAMAEVKNPILLDLESPIRIELLLEDGNYAEAKGLYLSFAQHHRNGKTQSEQHEVVALDGLFHSLEGEEVTSVEKEEMAIFFDNPFGKRLVASAPWPKEKLGNEETAKTYAQQEDIILAKTRSNVDVMTGSGERKLQSWVSFSFFMVIIVFVSCFLIAALTVAQGDEKPLRNMWVMAFGALAGLATIIFAAIARKKEPKDRTLPALLAGAFVLILSVLLSLTSLA